MNEDVRCIYELTDPKKEFEKFMLCSAIETDLNESDMKSEIFALSFFLTNNEAYQYNFKYLPNAYGKFLRFQKNIKMKQKILKVIISDLSCNEKVIEAINNSFELEISLNDLLASAIPEDIHFFEPINVEGASRKDKDDVVTITVKNKLVERTKSFYMNNDKGKGCNKIIANVEKLIVECDREDEVKNG